MQVEKFYYDNRIVKAFGYATVIFGIVGMLAGLWAAIQIYYPAISLNLALLLLAGSVHCTRMRSFSLLWVMLHLPVSIIPCSVYVRQDCSVTN